MEMVEFALKASSSVVVVQVAIQLMMAVAEEDMVEVMVEVMVGDDTEAVVANKDWTGWSMIPRMRGWIEGVHI